MLANVDMTPYELKYTYTARPINLKCTSGMSDAVATQSKLVRTILKSVWSMCVNIRKYILDESFDIGFYFLVSLYHKPASWC